MLGNIWTTFLAYHWNSYLFWSLIKDWLTFLLRDWLGGLTLSSMPFKINLSLCVWMFLGRCHFALLLPSSSWMSFVYIPWLGCDHFIPFAWRSFKVVSIGIILCPLVFVWIAPQFNIPGFWCACVCFRGHFSCLLSTVSLNHLIFIAVFVEVWSHQHSIMHKGRTHEF